MLLKLETDLADFDRHMDKIIRELDGSYQDQLEIWRDAAVPVVNEIKALVPVGNEVKHFYNKNREIVASFSPGTLRDSIKVHPDYKNAVVVTSVADGYNSYNADYALHFFMIEYGFSPRGGSTFVSGVGFMRRGATNAIPQVLRIFRDGYDKLLRKIIKKNGGG